MKRSLRLAALLLIASTAAGTAAAKPPPPQRPAPDPPKADAPPAPDCPGVGAPPANWSGTAYAVDGDTLRGVGLKPALRLWGIRAPQLLDATRQETVAGMRARAALADLLSRADHKVKCRIVRLDASCQAVAHCTLDTGADSLDLGGALLAAGMAYGAALDEALPAEPKAAQRYAEAEVEARRQRRGLWKAWLGE